MRTYYKENSQLYFILVFCLALGFLSAVSAYVIIPLLFIQMIRKQMYEELFITYFFILILSDSLYVPFYFAKNLKNILAGLIGFHFIIRTEEFSPLNKLYKLFLPFFLFAAITILTSMRDPFFLTGIQKTFSYFIFFLIIPNYIEKLVREKGIIFLKRFILFSVTMLLLGFVLKFVAHNIAYLETGRYRGVMGNPNGLGIYSLLLFLSSFIIQDIYPELFSKKEKLLIYAAILISIYMSDSRSAFTAILLFYMFQKFYGFSPFLGFILFLLISFSTYLISANISQIIMALGLNKFFRVQTLQDASGRYIAWEFAWKQIQQNFFVGKGFAYNEYYMRQHYSELSKLGHQGGIHNSFLTFWMDQGLIGLLIYIRSFVLVFIQASYKTRLAFPIMFAIVFSAMFESWLVGSLSAYALLCMVIFTLVTSDVIEPQEQELVSCPTKLI